MSPTDGLAVSTGWEAAINAADGTIGTFSYIRPSDTGVSGGAVKFVNVNLQIAQFNIFGYPFGYPNLDGSKYIIGHAEILSFKLCDNVRSFTNVVNGMMAGTADLIDGGLPRFTFTSKTVIGTLTVEINALDGVD